MKRYWYKTNLTKTILVVMEHILAVVMVVSFLWMLSYPALREEIFEGEPARRYEDSRGFATLVESRSTQALDWFWQVNEAYATGKYSKARSLIQEFETTGLVSYLPKESVTDNGRFSPADRYAEIVSSLS